MIAILDAFTCSRFEESDGFWAVLDVPGHEIRSDDVPDESEILRGRDDWYGSGSSLRMSLPESSGCARRLSSSSASLSVAGACLWT